MGEGEVGAEIQDKKLHRFRLLPTMHHDLFLSLVQKHHLFPRCCFHSSLWLEHSLNIKKIGRREDSRKQTNSHRQQEKKKKKTTKGKAQLNKADSKQGFLLAYLIFT